MSLTAADLKVGHVYSAKCPRVVGMFSRLLNDRQIIWIDSLGFQLQYDSPTVVPGRKYPRIEVEKFLKWAGSDVTALCPPDDWRKA
jgi:hypothetical protein